MQPDFVTPIDGPDVDHRVGIVGNGEVDWFVHQSVNGLCQSFLV